jgi:scyllo-inositol 2-dehydrogenase (NADP+)
MAAPVVTGLFSYGMSGEVFHCPLLMAHQGFELRYVAERSSLKANQKYPSIKSVKDYKQILNDDTVELVVVNTPNASHFAFAKEALLAGKHVVVEKPFTVSSHEADELISIAQQNKRVLTVFQNRRWDGDFLTVQQVVKDGWVGKPVEFVAHYDRFRVESYRYGVAFASVW